MAHPFGPLRFLYNGTADTGRDLKFFEEPLGAVKVWRFKEFGADVAAVRLGEGPLLLPADHRKAPSAHADLRSGGLGRDAKDLKKRGWKPKGSKFEIPNGPFYVFEDPSGNAHAVFEDVRPRVFECEARG